MKRVIILLIFLLATASLTMAQDATPETTTMPDGTIVVVPAVPVVVQGQNNATIADVTANSAQYYGQTVTLQGNVNNLLNVRAFVLGEGAVLDNDQVLVINTSNQEFNLWLTEGAQVQVTGIVRPAYNQNAFNDFTAMGATAEATPAMNNGTVPTIDYRQMFVPNNLRDFTLVELQSVDSVVLVNAAE